MATPFTDYTLYQQALLNVNLPLTEQTALTTETASYNAYLTGLHDDPATIHASAGPNGWDQLMFNAFVHANPVSGAPTLAAQTAMLASATNSLPAWLSGDYMFGTTGVPKVAVLGGGAALLLVLLASKSRK